MSLSVTELLKPRYKVINIYPESDRHYIKVGDILTENGRFETTRNQDGDARWTFEWEKFPHIFKQLQWWEERDEKDMPEYVRVVETGEVNKITKYFIDYQVACFYTGEIEKKGKLKGIETPFNLRATAPATESDYQQFLKERNSK